MSGGSRALRVAWWPRHPTGARDTSWWRIRWSKPAALRALRATLVIPALFAISFKVVGNLQMALFAGFGSFATLVLVSFAGTRRDKALAHLGLALAGSLLIVIGTAIGSSTAIAALVTVPVTFAVFFAGIAGPNAAAGVTGALLAYVLPAASPGTIAMIPDRLAGWWLASVGGTLAVLLIAAPSPARRLPKIMGRLTAALADELEATLAGTATDKTLAACLAANDELVAAFNATPLRPTGLAVRDQALDNAIELLEWCTSLVADSVGERSDLRDAPAVERAVVAAAADVLRQTGDLAGGSRTRPELDRLDAARRRASDWEYDLTPGTDAFEQQARLSFHSQAIATTALAVAADALVAERLAGPEWLEEARMRWFLDAPAPAARRLDGPRRYAGAAVRHASVRSVWFVSSLRGALALAAAVAVADLSSVQHGFWVVLGTLSVLRTNAAATGATALRALLGTVVGFAIGAGLLLALGTGSAALWVALPFAVMVAAYAPGTAPFAAGQAAFTITVAILFNLLVPVGWKVGELRVEDVAIGCAVSLVVGSLVWPRGVAPLVGDDLADAFRSGASYLREAVEWVSGGRPEPPLGGRAAVTSGLRLDEALHAFIAEQGTKHVSGDELWRLVGGTLRLRLTAHAIARLPPGCRHEAAASAAALGARAARLEAWYDELAAQVGRPRGLDLAPLVAPEADDGPPHARLPAPARGDGPDALPASRHAIWLNEHLDHLASHLDALVDPAARLAEVRRRPWWR